MKCFNKFGNFQRGCCVRLFQKKYIYKRKEKYSETFMTNTSSHNQWGFLWITISFFWYMNLGIWFLPVAFFTQMQAVCLTLLILNFSIYCFMHPFKNHYVQNVEYRFNSTLTTFLCAWLTDYTEAYLSINQSSWYFHATATVIQFPPKNIYLFL